MKNGEQTSKAKGGSENIRKGNLGDPKYNKVVAKGRERCVLCGATAFRGGALAGGARVIRESSAARIEVR